MDDPRRERDMNLRADASWRERRAGIRPWHVVGALVMLALLLMLYLKTPRARAESAGLWTPAPALVGA